MGLVAFVSMNAPLGVRLIYVRQGFGNDDADTEECGDGENEAASGGGMHMLLRVLLFCQETEVARFHSAMSQQPVKRV
jgi:hypothetical protein